MAWRAPDWSTEGWLEAHWSAVWLGAHQTLGWLKAHRSAVWLGAHKDVKRLASAHSPLLLHSITPKLLPGQFMLLLKCKLVPYMQPLTTLHTQFT
eukprot:1161850-Pelagomonas_calceolata.AAC.8